MIVRTSRRACCPGLALLVGLFLATSTAPTLAQAKKPADAAKSSPVKDLMQQAIEAANEGKFAAAMTKVDAAIKLDPKDRQPVFMLSVFASLAADQAKATPEKLACLKRSAAAYGQLRKMDGPMTPEEESFDERSHLDEARTLALEGKPKPALDALVKLVGKGYDDLDSIDDQPDLQTVRALPDFRAQIDQALAVGVKTMMAATKSFPFDFTLKDVDGKPLKLADARGKVTIVDVWGTWCPPCKKEIPHFVALDAKYGAKGLKIVGINCNEEGSPAEVKKTINDFKAETKIKYPCVLNDDSIEAKIPDFQGYPTTLFLDKNGKVRLVLVGYTPMARLEAIVGTLLAE